ncbi:MAG: SCP2 sterol-binding domain-containing protein [Coriobacteriia bacterium]|nr:SCP2 sterol-binding domain-containing protein [Coriobacteriia bacterium]
MKHRILAPFLLLSLRVLSRRIDVRRHLPDSEGESVALRLRGDKVPYVIAVRNERFVLDPSAQPAAEISGDLGTFLAMLLGRLDYDAAFFRKRISFSGSLPVAMRFKALFDQMTR